MASPRGDKVLAQERRLVLDFDPRVLSQSPSRAVFVAGWRPVCFGQSLSRTFWGHYGCEKLCGVGHIQFSKDSAAAVAADTNQRGSSRRHVCRCASSQACR